MAAAIEDHGLIGDGRTVALVSLGGEIDYLCWPHFDSPSVFASLLSEDGAGGVFSLAPTLDGGRVRQIYLTDTAVLFTRFLSPEGLGEVSDFMVLGGADGPRLVRRAKAIRGHVTFDMRCAPAFDYGRAGTRAEAGDGGVRFASDGPDGTRLALRSSVPLDVEDGAAHASIELEEGGTAWFVLGDPDSIDAVDDAWIAAAFKTTSDRWRDWVARSTYRGRWRDVVHRSAITLKMLTSADHGAMIAAGTFGLPEEIGGERNWDYRYVWLRDAAFTAYAFLRLGYTAEAQAFLNWLSARAEECGNGRFDILYRASGAPAPAEIALPNLTGHRRSGPVRIGNEAKDQFQLDIYGELMDAIYLSDKYGDRVSRDVWISLSRSLDFVADNWDRPDEGIWEIRDEPRHHLHSRLMCWVALDRGLRLAEKRSLPAPHARWREARDAIYADIHETFWNPAMGAFTQSRGGNAVDAACLLMPLVRFISPTDPRWLSTLHAVGEQLTDDNLVFRYSAEAAPDGLAGTEGTFNMCSFWYIECLARAGDLASARFLFDKMVSYANHLGLFAEETGPSGEQLGNFPQAFTHMALISAAHWLDRALEGNTG